MVDRQVGRIGHHVRARTAALHVTLTVEVSQLGKAFFGQHLWPRVVVASDDYIADMLLPIMPQPYQVFV